MTLTVAGRLYRRLEDLSPLTQQVLALIPSATAWAEWAIGASPTRFDFADESVLVAAVQSGLHGSDLVLLPTLGLAVSPLKLLSLGAADLKVVTGAEQNPQAAAVAKARKVLAKHGLLTPAEHWAGRALLSELGVSDAPVFQFMDSQDRAAVLGLLDTVRRAGTAIAREAALFALGKACSPAEFADYVEVYVTLALRAGQAAAPDARAAAVGAALEILQPWLFERLKGVRADGASDPSTVGEALRGWIRSGKTLGFTRLSVGVREVVAFLTQTNAATVVAAGQALVEATTALLAVARPTGVVAQDGSQRFRVQDEKYAAEVRLNPDGALTLDRLRPKA